MERGARALRSAVHGFATLEVAGGFGMPLDLDESFERLIATINRGMSGDRPRARRRGKQAADAHAARAGGARG